jgi:hypothetical protein
MSSSSVDLRTVYAFAREFHSKGPNIGKLQYGELAKKIKKNNQ